MVSLNQSLCTFPISEFPVGEIPVGRTSDPRNAHGYRCDEFHERKKINVVFIGDSWTEGSGVAFEKTFSQISCTILSEKLGVPIANWNMGHGGKGYEYIARTLMMTLDILEPDVVIVTLPSMDRREFFTEEIKCLDLGVSTLVAIDKGVINPPPLIGELYGHYKGLRSQWDDAAKAIMNYKLIELLLNEKNVIWGYSTNDWPPAPNRIAEFIKYGFFDSSRYLGYVFEKVDQISDTDGHPADKSHELYASRICDWLLSRHGGKLSSIASYKESEPPSNTGSVEKRPE